MKGLSRIVSLVLIGAVVLIGCKKDDPPVPSAEEMRLEELAGTSSLTWNVSSVTLDGADRASDWTGFTLTMTTTKTYSTGSSSDENVWPANGTWDFQTGTDGTVDVNTVLRSDNITVNIVSVTDNSLQLSFDYVLVAPPPGGRVQSIEGNWVFSFTR